MHVAIGSVLGLAGLLPALCNWVRNQNTPSESQRPASHIKPWPRTQRERESKAAHETPGAMIWRLKKTQDGLQLGTSWEAAQDQDAWRALAGGLHAGHQKAKETYSSQLILAVLETKGRQENTDRKIQPPLSTLFMHFHQANIVKIEDGHWTEEQCKCKQDQEGD